MLEKSIFVTKKLLKAGTFNKTRVERLKENPYGKNRSNNRTLSAAKPTRRS